MKLCSFSHQGRSSFGAVVDGGIIDLAPLFPGIKTLRAFLEADGLAKVATATAGVQPNFSLDEVSFEPVITDPGKIYCVGLNYRDHVAETHSVETEKPALFARFAGSQIGHKQPLIKPIETEMFDYEGELAVIIGKRGRRISEADALSHVAGYACYNDGSVRNWQRHTTQFLAGKTFYGTGGFGPWMVTSDEIADVSKLSLVTRVNGEVVQNTTTDLMINSIPSLIAYISTILPLEVGDVIVTGTPGGVGARRTPPLWLKHGDVVEVEISSVGCLSNTVVDEKLQ